MISPELEAEGTELAIDLKDLRINLSRATAAATRFARKAYAAGATEVELARLLGVDRARTIRRWLGKAK